MRSGGFGGPQGLTRVSARHRCRGGDRCDPPVRGADHRACRARLRRRRRARFRLQRATWQLQPGDSWHAVATIAEGLAWLQPRARRVFATLGRDVRWPNWARREAFTFVMRGITRPADLPAQRGLDPGRPPFPVEDEVALLRRHEVRRPVHPGQRRRADLRQDRGGARAEPAGGDADPASAAGGCVRLGAGGDGLAGRRPRPQDVRVIGGVEPALGEARLVQHPARP